MTKKTRTIIFFICVILFLLIAPSVVFYSMGYRFDFDSKKIVSTGAFYFKIWPKSAQIYLDSKLKKETDFFFGSAYIGNLLPKKYEVEIKKAGFHSWRKNLEIEERKVTELKNVFLIPENPSFTDLIKNVDYFWSSPDEKKIVLKKINENGWALKIFELEKNLKTHLLDEKDFRKEKEVQVELLDLKYSPDSKKILLKVKKEGEEKYFILEVEEIPANLISLDFLGEDIGKISFNPISPQKIFFSTGNSLFEADFLEKEKSQILENLITFEISDRNIFFISNDGFLFRADLSGEIQEKINSEAIFLKDKAKYQIHIKKGEFFLLENDTLYFFNKGSEKFEKLFERIKNFEISPDFKKIFFSSGHEIWILFLKEIYDQPPKKVGEKLFLTRFSGEIDRVFWWTSHYLIFSVSGKIKVAEIDDRDMINIVDLAEFKEPKIFFNRIDKKLYVLDEKNLFISERLLPR